MKKIILATLGMGLLAVGFNANAGAGGIAGAVAIHMNAGVVDWSSSSIAIGKTSAYAGANSSATTATSLAAGAGGKITMNTTDKLYIGDIAIDGNLGTAQANLLSGDIIDINAKTATETGTVK